MNFEQNYCNQDDRMMFEVSGRANFNVLSGFLSCDVRGRLN